MKKHFATYLLCFAVIFCSKNAFAQTDSLFKFNNSIDQRIVSFSVNNLGEIFFINPDNQLKKIGVNGDSVGVFNDVSRYGKLSYVDAQNPWKTLLYYKNFSTIVLLDKYLNVVTSLNLRKQNLFKANAVTVSYDNNLWVYDEENAKLKKLDETGKILSETNDLRNVFDSVPSAAFLLDREGFVYLYDTAKGLYIFDRYGGFKNRLRFLNWKSIAVYGNIVYGFDDKFVYKYEVGSLNLQQYPLPISFKGFKDVKIENKRLYLLKDDCIYIYSIL